MALTPDWRWYDNFLIKVKTSICPGWGKSHITDVIDKRRYKVAK